MGVNKLRIFCGVQNFSFPCKEYLLQARTIDLCNNPLTKEPKLASARRTIKEWPHLNREAEEFTQLVGAVANRTGIEIAKMATSVEWSDT